MRTNTFDFSGTATFPLPLLRASGPDDDVKTVVTPEDESISEEVGAEATPDAASGPDDDTKTQ